MEQAILKPGAADFDMLGQLELTLKRAPGNALMQEGRLGIGVGFRACPARSGRHHATSMPRSFSAKPATAMVTRIMILVAALDIVGRVALGVAVRLIQQIKQAVEADGGTEKRGMIQTHGDNLLKALRTARDIRAGSGADSPPEQPLDRLEKSRFKTLEIAAGAAMPGAQHSAITA